MISNMKNITYQIEMFAPWHCGSGLSAGADVDALVVKDKDGLPFIPGKTLKGLVREAVEDYCTFSQQDAKEDIIKAFGLGNDGEELHHGTAFFSNATLCDHEREAIIAEKAQSFLYDKVASTAIGEDGIAKKFSLRKMEVTVPCILYAEIDNVDERMADIIEKSMGLIKRLGQNRNRGLGRCRWQVIQEGGEQ